MFAVFHKIRKGLMQKNKLTNYFLYAVGEIILVVLGILIAIQINNLYQQRLDRKAEKAILEKLIADLDADYEWLISTDSFYQSSLQQIDNTRILLQRPKLNEDEIRQVSLFYGAEVEVLSSQTAAFDEMINSGNLYKLNNQALLRAITNYYRLTQEYSFKATEDRREFRNLFYGPEYLEFFYPWSFDDPEIQFSLSKKIFSRPNSEIYKRVLQAANWSSGIIKRGSSRYQRLSALNRQLKDSITAEIL